MTVAVVTLAGLAVILAGLLYLQQRRHERLLADVVRDARHERAQLIDKISAPHRPMNAPGRVKPLPPRRTKAQQRDYSRVGTVAPPRDPSEPDGDEE